VGEASALISVLFVFRRKRKERLQLHEAGQGPDEMLYGLTRFNLKQFQVEFIEGDDSKWNWRRRLCYPLEKWIAWRLGIGFVLHLALDNLEKLRQVDLIISTVDSCGLPIAMFKYLGLVKTPIIYISQGLSDRIDRLPRSSRTRRWFQKIYGRFLHSVERIIVLSEGAAKHLEEIFQLRPQSVFCLPFGIDAQFWAPGPDSDIGDYILSVGSDATRDYETLLSAVTRERLKIVSRLDIPGERLNDRVEVGSEFTDVELRELYRRARFVVTPLKDVYQPSGQSATLQAMACGKAVILTRTRGLWEPGQMRHLENCYLVEPGDAGDLRQAIGYLSDHPDEAMRIGQNARRTVEERYNSRRFAAELEHYADGVLATQVV
jgi:glycosyltransferase involved in cell wall biosynthesis